MTPEEVVDLLSTAAAYDRRKVGEADVIAWHAAVKDLDFLDAQNAVIGHYTQSTDWLMPAHVRVRVAAIRASRIALAPPPAPDRELTDRPRDYREALQKALHKHASGYALPKQVTARTEPSEPPEEYAELRGGDRDPLRIEAILVPCPWPPCRAVAGAGCVDGQGHRLPAPAHEARLKAAGLLDDDGQAGSPERAP